MAGRVHIAWAESPESLANQLEAWWGRVEGRLSSEITAAGQTILAYAKASHPWQNRTGAAEAGLSMQVEQGRDSITLTISHGVYYGIYLEGRWGGRWGVLPATISMGAPLVMAAALSAMRG